MKILLGVTGSVSAVLTDKLVAELEKSGHEVKVVFSWNVIYFWRKGFWLYLLSILYSKVGYLLLPRTLANEALLRFKHFTDFHEWRGFSYHKEDQILHIALRDWADALLIAPLSANTLAKAANSICDNLLLSVIRAWDPAKRMIVAPAMNTKMWQHPLTQEHLARLANWYRLTIVEPVEKRLACGEVGVGALAKIETITQAVRNA